MAQLALLIVCLLLGFVLARLAKPPAMLARCLNWWVLYVALPALVLSLVAQIQLNRHLWYLPVSLWCVFLGAWIFFAVLGKLLHWPRERIGALTLVCGLGNTAFMGYPMLEAFRGQEGLALGVIADQLGCFVTLALASALIPALYANTSKTTIGVSHVIRRVVFFPAFIALVVALLVGAMGGWPPVIDNILNRIGSTLIPLALFSVGLQIHAKLNATQLPPLLLGLGWKLLLAPLMVYFLGIAVGTHGLTLTVSVLQAAMAPMVTATIVAEQNNLAPKLANLLLAVGIVVSFITVPLINSFFS